MENDVKINGSEKRYYFSKTPDYIRSPHVGLIFAQLFPQIKVLVTFRNPLKRTWSTIAHFRQSEVHSKQSAEQ